jgi:Phosphatase
VRWREAGLDHDWFIEHHDGVAMLSDGRAPRHTHKPDAMERMLAEGRPDLVFADHGFAGAAIEAGVETISIADVNDTALLVAKEQGRTQHVLVFDDHVDPNAYWPVFLALTSNDV